MITASHNPKQYNGYKVYWRDGGQLPPERAAQVFEKIERLSFTDYKTMDEKLAKDQGCCASSERTRTTAIWKRCAPCAFGRSCAGAWASSCAWSIPP